MTPERWRQIEDLFHAARERTADERAALLAGAEAEVRGEVEALLAKDKSGKFLDRPATDLLTEETAAAVAVGTQVGPYFILGQVYAQQGRFAEAIAAEQKSREKGGGPYQLLASYYVHAGRPAEARQALADLLASAKRQYVSKYPIAAVYAAMGDKDQALAQLEQAYQDRTGWIAWLKVAPEMDSLRSDPRFQDLMRRLNFPR
jgi:tetratricopeptide (TPR) repeat protein